MGRQPRYLARLCDRMQAMGFLPNDPLYVAAMKARCEVSPYTGHPPTGSEWHGGIVA